MFVLFAISFIEIEDNWLVCFEPSDTYHLTEPPVSTPADEVVSHYCCGQFWHTFCGSLCHGRGIVSIKAYQFVYFQTCQPRGVCRCRVKLKVFQNFNRESAVLVELAHAGIARRPSYAVPFNSIRTREGVEYWPRDLEPVSDSTAPHGMHRACRVRLAVIRRWCCYCWCVEWEHRP